LQKPARSSPRPTLAKGASLEDPSRLFNSSLEGSAKRIFDIHEGDKLDEAAMKALIRAAVALNLEGKLWPPGLGTSGLGIDTYSLFLLSFSRRL
jgi:hypothetical protein